MDVNGSTLPGGSAVVLSAILALSGAGSAVAAPSQEETSRNRRLIQGFDFEEQITSDWSHIFMQEPSLPPKGLFFEATGDSRIQHDGAMSLRLNLLGGSISYRTGPQIEIPTDPDARYLVRGWVRTEGLGHAGARIEARILDGERFEEIRTEGEDPVIAATLGEFATPRIQTDGRWRLVEVLVDTSGEAIRTGRKLRMALALQVVQPSFIQDVVGERIKPLMEDVEGVAWFDSVEVWQLPRADCAVTAGPSGEPSGGFAMVSDEPHLEMVVNDPVDPAPVVELVIRNLDEQLVRQETFTTTSSSVPFSRDLKLDAPGWYEISMRVFSGEDLVSEQFRSLLVRSDSGHEPRHSAPRIGYAIGNWKLGDIERVEQVMDVLNPGLVEFAIWPEANDGFSPDAGISALRNTVTLQQRRSREVLFSVERIHPNIAQLANATPIEVATILNTDPSVWKHEFEKWFLAFGTTVDHWQFATLVDASAFDGVPPVLGSLMQNLVAEPILSLPRELDMDRSGLDSPFSDYLLASPTMGAEAQAVMLGSGESKGATIKLAAPPMDWGKRDRVDETARRILAAWQAGADRIICPMPSTEEGPGPEFLAWSSLGSALSGRRPVGTLHASPTATCLIAGGDDGIIVVAYSDQLGRAERLELPLGSSQVEIESIDGRRWSVPNQDGIHVVEVSSTPVVIRGGDPGVVAMASGMAFEPGTIRSRRGSQEISLVVRNPFAFAIEGALEFNEPDNWKIDPRRRRFRIGANGQQEIPLAISWDRIPRLGEAVIPVRIEADADRTIDARIAVPLKVVSPNIQVEADWSLASSAVDGSSGVVITMEVINRSDQPIDLEASAVAWQTGRERMKISDLEPGGRAVRRFQFKADLARLAGTEILLVVEDMDGPDAVSVGIPIVGGESQAAVVPAD